jgi:putative endonuclease
MYDEMEIILNSEFVGEWFVYIVECSDKTLYCGSTNNIQKRMDAHNKNKGAKYTKGRGPVNLMICRGNLTKSQALSLESKVKKQKRDKKAEFLIGFSFEKGQTN